MNNKSRLTFIHNVPSKNYRAYAKYKCSCGNTVEIRKDHVKSGNTLSCGCLNRETRKSRIKKDIHDKGLHKLGARNPCKNHNYKKGKILFYEDLSKRKRVQLRSKLGNLYWKYTSKSGVFLTPKEIDKKLEVLWSQDVA